MIKGGNSNYHDSLEELFILQNFAELKAIRYKVFTVDFGFKMSGDQTGTFYIFGFTHLRLLNEASSYEKRLMCFSQ